MQLTEADHRTCEGSHKRRPRRRRLTGHAESYRTSRLASIFLEMRSADILNFVRTASDIATCMFETRLDPIVEQEVDVARHVRDRKVQRARCSSSKRSRTRGDSLATVPAGS